MTATDTTDDRAPWERRAASRPSADPAPVDDPTPTTDPEDSPAQGSAAGDDIAVSIRGLRKVFGGGLGRSASTHVALDGVDLDVRAGTVHALLGPNGAGKTTTVRIISTLLAPDGGTVRVLGHDVGREAVAVRKAIGVSGQYAAVDGNLTAFENLSMVGRLYGMGRRAAGVRARELLDDFRLADVADRPTRTFSGGMRRRIDLAGALVARPRLVILDEPTTGLDPRGRRDMWSLITDLVTGGTTVLLTTQYLEEADTLADEITVIDKGAVIAHGTAAELKSTITQSFLTVEVAADADSTTVTDVLSRVGIAAPAATDAASTWTVAVDDGTRSAAAAVAELTSAGVGVVDATVSAPTLDDVFLTLTAEKEVDA
ncbi:ATP-binding cassette domain-containing protein [Williamsia deligens]|uniref:ATP-binding cassette domain-containing protein n=1 Tax=Williamsia deligens TaxID=321325 RepID=A0ABW3G7E4_9NOCA|nr:ATP-binding cassette domain-containing protein [Williamsia deligens]MCP2192595.1 ABC-2 type transport system ATP-binding protein [Williamsia deligens]